MKMNSFRIICHTLILIFLLAVSGCAKQMVAAKNIDQLSSDSPVFIKELKISGDGKQAEIIVNKPITYTSYKTSDPAKIYIDLAQTEPGQIKPVQSEAGDIREITVSRQDFGSGFLSRIEIGLRKDSEFVVKSDAYDKGILRVSLSSDNIAQNQKSSVGSKSATDETEPLTQDPVEVKPVAAVTSGDVTSEPQNSITTPATDQTTAKYLKDDKSTHATAEHEQGDDKLKALTTLKVRDGVIELAVLDGPITFTSFRLNKPDRLVIDLFEVKNALQANTIPINKFGISNARIGTSPGKVRIVFDSAKGQIPTHRIEKVEAGLNVVLNDPDVHTSAKPMDNAPPPVKPSEDQLGVTNTGNGTIESIDFSMADGVSRIEVKTNGACTIDKPAETAKGILLSFKTCELPKKLQRSIDTKAFASSIVTITPYQVKIAGTNNARILLKIRNKTLFSDHKEGNTYVFEAKNPSIAAQANRAKEKPVPFPTIIENELMSTPSRDGDSGDLPKSVITKQQPKKVYSGRKVTLEFSDADIRKIFQLIAEVSNLNFLIADDVTGNISIKLVNVPWDQALDVILDTKNLGMIREGNIVQIKPKNKMQSLADEEIAAKKARERGMELRTEIFDVNYAAVTDIATQFSTLKSERGVISTDTRTNRVIVKDISSAIDDMKSLLKNLDTPEKQVMIEARIVEASTSFVRDIGVQWGIHYVDGSASVAGINRLDTGFGGQVVSAPASGTSGPGAAVGMSFGKLTSNIQLDMRLSAAVTADQIKIMSTPRVVTLNNKPAKISQGASIPYQTTSAEGTKTEFVEAALTLEVTPHITADGSIGMKIKASNNSAGTGSPPPINKKEATTELLVKNGETTVIGGIYVDSDTESDKGVPFLQDIPLLGWLFKSNSKNKTKNELLIFITPKIVS